MRLKRLPTNIQIAANGLTLWVHCPVDGTTVGWFYFRFGMDVHNTFAAQLGGAPQCLQCAHEPPTEQDWKDFRTAMQQHHGLPVDSAIRRFGATEKSLRFKAHPSHCAFVDSANKCFPSGIFYLS